MCTFTQRLCCNSLALSSTELTFRRILFLSLVVQQIERLRRWKRNSLRCNRRKILHRLVPLHLARVLHKLQRRPQRKISSTTCYPPKILPPPPHRQRKIQRRQTRLVRSILQRLDYPRNLISNRRILQGKCKISPFLFFSLPLSCTYF